MEDRTEGRTEGRPDGGTAWSDVAAHLTGLAHLATVRADGRPHVAIVSPRVEGELVWFGARRSSAKVGNLLTRPLGALMWSSGAEAYVDVRTEIVHDVAVKRRLWDGWAYDPAAFFGTPEDDDYVLVRCTPTAATVMSMGEHGLERCRWTAGG